MTAQLEKVLGQFDLSDLEKKGNTTISNAGISNEYFESLRVPTAGLGCSLGLRQG
jgi:hypothetical protein